MSWWYRGTKVELVGWWVRPTLRPELPSALRVSEYPSSPNPRPARTPALLSHNSVTPKQPTMILLNEDGDTVRSVSHQRVGKEGPADLGWLELDGRWQGLPRSRPESRQCQTQQLQHQPTQGSQWGTLCVVSSRSPCFSLQIRRHEENILHVSFRYPFIIGKKHLSTNYSSIKCNWSLSPVCS